MLSEPSCLSVSVYEDADMILKNLRSNLGVELLPMTSARTNIELEDAWFGEQA